MSGEWRDGIDNSESDAASKHRRRPAQPVRAEGDDKYLSQRRVNARRPMKFLGRPLTNVTNCVCAARKESASWPIVGWLTGIENTLWSSAMPINIPFENHGACSVALIALRSHPKRVYHYSKTTGQEQSWAVRDYLTGQIVRSGDSTLTASQIEDTVEYAEKPAYRSVKLIPRWQADCRAASGNHFGAAHVDTTTPNPATLGNWQRMSSQGS